MRTTEAISRAVWCSPACPVKFQPEVSTAAHVVVTSPSIEDNIVDQVGTSERLPARESLPSKKKLVMQTISKGQVVLEPEELDGDPPLMPETAASCSAVKNITGTECTVGENDEAAFLFGTSMHDESGVWELWRTEWAAVVF